MKHVRESLSQFNTYKFFKMFEEESDKSSNKDSLKQKEQDGLAIVDKLIKNFDEFKKEANGEILKYKEFWEETQKVKKSFSEGGNIYKMFSDDYVGGVMQLKPEIAPDGGIEGGLGATEEPEEEIIEGKQITEAEGSEDALDLDLDSNNKTKQPAEEPAEQPAEQSIEEPAEQPVEEPKPEADLTTPQTYFVLYDMSGGEREEIFRCGSNNVVKSFNSFYNDSFKGSMKDIIAKFKQQKEMEKKEIEAKEKQKAQKDKQSKVDKFLSEAKEEDIIDSEGEENSDEWQEWLDQVEDILKHDYDLDDHEVGVFTAIADDELSHLFDGGSSPFDAANTVASNEDIWDEFHTSKEEDEYEDEDFEDEDLDYEEIGDEEDFIETEEEFYDKEDLESEEDEKY